MKFLVDAQLPRRLVQELIIAGHEAIHPKISSRFFFVSGRIPHFLSLSEANTNHYLTSDLNVHRRRALSPSLRWRRNFGSSTAESGRSGEFQGTALLILEAIQSGVKAMVQPGGQALTANPDSPKGQRKGVWRVSLRRLCWINNA